MPELLKNYVRSIARKYNITEDAGFEVLSMVLVLDKPYDEIYREVWTGGHNDGGIDGVYVDEQAHTIYIFQCKNSPALAENELLALETNFNDLFAQDNRSGRAIINQKMQARIAEYKDFTQKGLVLEPKLFFVYAGKNEDTLHAANRELVSRFSSRRTVPEYIIIDSPELLARAANLQKTRRDQVTFTFDAEETTITGYFNQAIFSYSIAEVRAVNFRIKALDLCHLIDKEVEINGSIDTLYSENIRGYLGHNKANKRILATLKDQGKSVYFPFMNNGLTIICPTMQIPSGPQSGRYNIPVTDPIIVNGLQTSKIIYEVYKENEELLTNVFITIKLYEARDQNLTDLITEATNTQTAINFRDQMSNKLFNGWAHDYFAAHGIKYVSKRGETMREDDLSVGLRDSVSNELVIKFWYATYNTDPHRAKTSKTGVLEDVFLATKDENPRLANLFSGNHDSPIYSQLLNAYRIYKLIAHEREILEEQDGFDYIVHADELMAYGIYKELEKRANLDNPSDNDIEQAYQVVQPCIGSLVTSEKERRGESYANTKYFKSDGIVEDYDQVLTS